MSGEAHGRLLARNTALNLVGFGAPMVVALLAVPLLVGGLGPERFGILALAWMALLYLGEMGFGATTTRFAAAALGRGADGELGRIAWTTAVMQTAVGALQGVALYLAAPWLVHSVFRIPPEMVAEALFCFRVLAVALPIMGLSKSFMGVLEAGQRFDLITMVRAPAAAASYLLPVAGLAAGWGLRGAFTLLLVARVLALAGYAALAVRTFPAAGWRPGLHREGWRRMLSFGGWTAVSTVVSPLLVQADRFLIGALLSMAAVAYYAAPYELIVRLGVVPLALMATLFPALSRLGGAGEHARASRLAARSVKAILLVMAPLVVVMIGAASDGLRLWLGADFAAQGALALRILAVGVLVNAAAQVPFVLLHSAGRPDVTARIHLVELPLHLALAWWLVRGWGVPGAALAWTARAALDAALLFVAVHRMGLLRVEALVAERAQRAAGLAVAGMAAALLPLGIDQVAIRLGLVALIAVAGGLVLWHWGMEQAERSSVITAIRTPATP